MTEKYFFDTDCISAFLWVREESILAKLYSGRIILPAQVYNELQRVPHLLSRVDALKNNGELIVESMETGSAEYNDYLHMTISPEAGMRIIGKGEAAGIAMVKQRGGTLASNNCKWPYSAAGRAAFPGQSGPCSAAMNLLFDITRRSGAPLHRIL